MTVVRVIVLSILLCIASLGNLACTYNGTIREDFHQQAAGFGGKLPLKVAVVADPTIKTYVFHASGHGFTQHIAVHPGLINATAAELRELFDQVRVVDQPEQATEEELLGFVRLSTRTLRNASFGVMDVYSYRLLLSIYDHDRNLVVERQHSGEIRPAERPGATGVAAFMLGATLGLSAPISLPIMNYSTGAHKKELLEDSLHEALRAISSDMRNDRRLLAYGGISNEGAQQAAARAIMLFLTPTK